MRTQAATPAPLQRTTSTPLTQTAPALTQQRTMATQMQPPVTPLSPQAPPKPTPTPVPPPDVKAYLDRLIAKSKDQKFHLTVNGQDLPLTPFHVWRQKSTGPDSTSTCIDMRSDEGRVYDIDFITTGQQVTNIRIHRINGEAVR